MAIPWFTVLQAIPWGQVIENTPKLVDGAQKLFSRLKKDKAPDDIATEPLAADDATRLYQLEKRVQENRHEVQMLHQNLRDTADLLQHLTEQNAKIVSEIEGLRQRTQRLQWLLAVTVLTLIATALRVFLP